MRPGYWIGIMALIGAIIGYLVFRLTGWLDVTTGTVAGILVGALVAAAWQGRSTATHR